MFNTLTTCYLFLGGTGAGALAVLSALECIGARESHLNPAASASSPISKRSSIRAALTLPDDCFSRCWPVCFIALATGILCLFADLGRPDRIINLLLTPEPSAIAVGSYMLVGSLVCSAAFSALALLDTPRIPRAATVILALIGIITGIATMTYTGLLLQSMASVLFWQTWLLPALFILSSLSCGFGIVFLGATFVETRQPFIYPLVWLSRFDSILIIAEAICLAAYVGLAQGNEGTALAANALLFGEMSWLFWIGLVASGLTAPLVMERFVTHGNYRTQLLWIAVFLLVGG
ncbi:MAG: NrfD/PsrC family molybdoenzyme membrane anchor subunit, partial [Raoultibacter sp.]